MIPPDGVEPPTRIPDIEIPRPLAQGVTGSRGMYTLHLRDMPPQSSAVFRMVSDQYPAPTDDPDELEATFWESLTNAASAASADSAYYGADIDASVFAQAPEYPWNLNRLDSLVNLLPVRIGGINAPMVYFGAWRSMFGLHVEDMNLSSINYLHAGAPKLWYGIAAAHASRVQRLCASWFPDQALRCAEFLRHKNNMVAPSRFLQHHVELHRCVQRAGEFVITAPRAYHFGFNAGTNVAEAVNFAFEGWFPLGDIAKCCQCCGPGGAVWFECAELKRALRESAPCAHCRLRYCQRSRCPAAKRRREAALAEGGAGAPARAAADDAPEAAAREAGKVPREATTRAGDAPPQDESAPAGNARQAHGDSAGASKTETERAVRPRVADALEAPVEKRLRVADAAAE